MVTEDNHGALANRGSHNFVLTIYGLDAFLVKSVQLPTAYKDGDEVNLSDMNVTFHEIQKVSNYKAVLDMMVEGARYDAVMKFLDNEGIVTEEWTMSVEPTTVTPSPLEYDSDAFFTVEVSFAVHSLDIKLH